MIVSRQRPAARRGLRAPAWRAAPLLILALAAWSCRATPAAPDILVILLDAARPGHFGAYGYPRATTPNLDRLAAESLVFRQAYSECASTSCSMPNLVTGLPFLPLGEEARAKVLPEERTTIAEALQAAGYRTVGVSANPNHSRAHRLDQGYDHFVETWRETGLGSRQALHPKAVTTQALEAIRSQPSDRPLFLFLHYIPPHEPYAPPDRFHVFGDPGYAGPVDGARGVTLRFRKGKIQLDDDDRAELVARYDGNLLWVDSWVGRVLAAQRASGRWDRTLVLVVSDHGEALFEHGRQGHNATVYEEMIRVPFILRLPRGERPPAVDEDAPVALSDVMPTLLARAGVAAPAGAAGIDVTVSPPPRDRVLFHRTVVLRRPSYAVRAGRWKLVVPPGGGAELYDLVQDPGEADDRAAERPELVETLERLLRRHLEESLQAEDGGGSRPIPEEDRRQLRALGYL